MTEPTPELSGRRILVVEDEPGIRDGLDMLLGLEGYAVSTAANGLLALQVLDETPIAPAPQESSGAIALFSLRMLRGQGR